MSGGHFGRIFLNTDILDLLDSVTSADETWLRERFPETLAALDDVRAAVYRAIENQEAIDAAIDALDRVTCGDAAEDRYDDKALAAAIRKRPIPTDADTGTLEGS